MIKIEVLYGEVCNLYGELKNIEYLKKCIKDVTIINTKLNEEPYFIKNKVDMIFMAPMTESIQDKVIEKTMKYKDNFKKEINNGTLMLFTGNAYEIFGKYIDDGKNKIKCLNILNFYTKRHLDNRINQFIQGKYDEITILGYKSIFTETYSNEPEFLEVQKGSGTNLESKKEGIHINNLYATSLLGPILILNPDFTKRILRILGQKEELLYEDLIYKTYEIRLKEFNDRIKE